MKFVKKIALATALSLASFLPSNYNAFAKENNTNTKPVSAQPVLTLEEQIQNIEEAKVEIRNGNEQRAVFGSGCVYLKQGGYYYILTNHHVVEGSLPGQLKLIDGGDDAYEEDDLPLEIVLASETKDTAIVRVKEEDVMKYNKLRDEYNAVEKNKKKKIDVFKGEIGNSDDVNLLDTIIVSGYPLTISSMAEGKLSSKLREHIGYGNDHEDFLIQTPVSPGNSGSAAYLLRDNKLYLIGLVHAKYMRGENMNLAIKVNEFKEMLFEFKNPDDPTEEDIKKIAERSEKNNQLDNLFIISSGQAYLTQTPDGNMTIYVPRKNILLAASQDGGFKFVIYRDNFPDNTVERTEFVDKKENGLGNIDTVIFKDRETASLEDVATMPQWLQSMFQNTYKIMVKNISHYVEYKKLLNKEGKLSFAETEKLQRYEKRVKMFSEQILTKLQQLETKVNEYHAQEKQKKLEEQKKKEEEKNKENKKPEEKK